MNLRTRAVGVALAAGLLVVAACGGGDDDAEATTTSAEPTTTSTTAATTTTAAPTTAAPTTTAAPAPTYPLTGLPVTDPVTLERPALVVKIDSHPRARPQSGLSAADVVYEEIVEGITRLFAVFQSQGSDPVGPIRSARSSDIDLLDMLSTPLFSFSGANPGVLAQVRNADATDVSAGRFYQEGGYFRDSSRRAPHNFYGQTSKLWTLAPAGQGAPTPIFTYRPAGQPAPGTPSAGAKVTMFGTRVLWTWDPTAGGWARVQDGTPHVDVTGNQLKPANVVVQFTQYGRSQADANSPEAITVGEGEVWVFSGGTVQRGTWKRPSADVPAAYQAADGQPITLAPGQTWVELAKPGGAVVIDPGVDPAAVPWPPG